MSKITFTRLTGIDGAALFITTVGEAVTAVLQSEMGCGKSSVLKLIAQNHGDKWRKPGDHFPSDKYCYVYIDCPNVQPGSLISDIPVHATKQLEEYIKASLCMSDKRPKVIMWDEYLKMPKILKPLTTRAINERTVGDQPLPAGSLMFATSNNAIDGVMDNLATHEGNRVTILQMRKPNVKEWLYWASGNEINPVVCAAVQMEPSLLASYATLSEQELTANPYIFNPFKPSPTFVSPRSLERASKILDKRTIMGDELTWAGVAGTLGEAGANILKTVAMMEKDLIAFDVIVADPKTAPVPSSNIVMMITLFRALNQITTQDELSAFVTYSGRCPSEDIRDVFYLMAYKGKTAKLARNNQDINGWFVKNYPLAK